MKKIFFIITVICFLLGHCLLFFAWQYFLNLDYLASRYLGIIIFGLALMSGSASWLIYWRDNFSTRFIYLLSGLWAGIILNSLLLFLPFYLLDLFLTVDFSYLSFIYFLLQLPLLLTEFLAAYCLKTRSIEVAITDLPANWAGKRAVHISDVHLGPVWRSEFFKRLIKKVNNLQPDIIFITGDLFDGLEADFSWLSVSPNKLFAPQGVYYSFGNHDEDLGSAKVRELLGNGGIKVLENDRLEKNGLQIIGLVCGHKKRFDVKQTILDQLNYDPQKPSILLFHEPRDLPAARAAGIDLQLSGHTHAGQMFPFNLVNKLLYAGRDFGLFKKNGLILSVTAGAGTWGPPLRLGSRSEIVEITFKAKNN